MSIKIQKARLIKPISEIEKFDVRDYNIHLSVTDKTSRQKISGI